MPQVVAPERRDLGRRVHEREQLVHEQRAGDADDRSLTPARSAAPRRRCARPPPSRRSPCRRAATAVRPTLTISASAMTIQTQNTAVVTAASPRAPDPRARPRTRRPERRPSSAGSTRPPAARAGESPTESGSSNDARDASRHPSAQRVPRHRGPRTATRPPARIRQRPRRRLGRRRELSRHRAAGASNARRRDRRARGVRARPTLPARRRRSAAAIAALGTRGYERDLAEQRKLELVGEPLAAARAEDRRRLAAVRALEPAHVLDDAEHRHAHALEHLRAAQRVARRRPPAAS